MMYSMFYPHWFNPRLNSIEVNLSRLVTDRYIYNGKNKAGIYPSGKIPRGVIRAIMTRKNFSYYVYSGTEYIILTLLTI